MATQIFATQIAQDRSAVSVLIQNMAALAFGVIILFVIGFAPMDISHTAAHDTRHTLAFPCH